MPRKPKLHKIKKKYLDKAVEHATAYLKARHVDVEKFKVTVKPRAPGKSLWECEAWIDFLLPDGQTGFYFSYLVERDGTLDPFKVGFL